MSNNRTLPRAPGADDDAMQSAQLPPRRMNGSTTSSSHGGGLRGQAGLLNASDDNLNAEAARLLNQHRPSMQQSLQSLHSQQSAPRSRSTSNSSSVPMQDMRGVSGGSGGGNSNYAQYYPGGGSGGSPHSDYARYEQQPHPLQHQQQQIQQQQPYRHDYSPSSQHSLSQAPYMSGGGGSYALNSPAMAPEVNRLSRVVRKKTVKRVELFRGNLVINCPVPDKLIRNVPFKDVEEVAMMRYTAVTSEPDDFIRCNFTLRPQLYGRTTELFVVMTMYNEDEILFARTMSAVMKNISYLCTRDRSSMWGPDGWKKVVVCVVADGRAKVHPRVLETLGVMGVYQEGVAKSEVNGRPVSAHVYEYTTQICVDPDMEIRGAEKGYVPTQILFCLKEQNKKKLNSHRWFFNAFAPLLNPNVCVLLDVGTKPTTQSIYHLWKAFDLDPCVGGACGEIAADIGRGCVNLINPLVAAQNFEYKMSNILDKPLESAFGYISVLPGAFSAYRYAALKNSSNGAGPLASYFEGEKLHDGSANIFKANMYLAEDRILCFELVAKTKSNWVLKYVKAAHAETDVPDKLPEFISQRRRWLNGSFFASTYALVHWYKIWGTSHSMFQKILFQFQLIYNTVSTVFTWFMLGNFYLTFYFLSQNMIGQNDPFIVGDTHYGDLVFQLFRQIYLFAIIVIFIASLGNRPQGSRVIYIICVLLFALIMALMLFLAGYSIGVTISNSIGNQRAINPSIPTGQALGRAISESPAFRDIFISLASTWGIYMLASLLYADPWHMITCFVQYLFLLPSFVNILMVYAFCNTHDVSWGTKGDNKASSLGSATTAKKGEGKSDAVDVELPFENHKDKEMLNSDYDRWLRSLPNRPPASPSKRDLATKLEDWYRNFRTRMVLCWMFSNALLIVVMTNVVAGADPTSNPYLTFIFWSFMGLSAVRLVGSLVYLIGYWGERYGSCRC